MSPAEFCAFLQGFFEIADAARGERSKPMTLNAAQTKIIRDKLMSTMPDKKGECCGPGRTAEHLGLYDPLRNGGPTPAA